MGIVPDFFIPSGKETDLLNQHDLIARFFGSFDIYFKGAKLKKVPGRKVSSLLAYLLLHHRRPVHREVLMDLFWGDNTPSSARNSLNVAIHHIRRHFSRAFPEQEIILYKNENYIINPELDIITDVELFTSQWRKGRIVDSSQGLDAAVPAYNKAAGFYRGDFLEELRYDEWCAAERDNLLETYLFLLDRLSSYFLQDGCYAAAINLCKKALSKDPCLEDMHRRLIACYDRLDYRDLAIRQYYRCREILQKELGVEPSEETRMLFQSISQR
jgi:DNA-binding SARP family transcriptional activator